MKLRLRPVAAISSREEVFFNRAKRRRGQVSGGEFRVQRVAQVPALAAEALALQELRRELGLSERAAASALGLRREQLLAVERGEATAEDPDAWPAAMAALRAAAEKAARRDSSEW